MKMPRNIGPVHFVGIGGIGMSGIAEIMHNLGYKVQGSDAADSANVKRLRAMGIPVWVGHVPRGIGTTAGAGALCSILQRAGFQRHRREEVPSRASRHQNEYAHSAGTIAMPR